MQRKFARKVEFLKQRLGRFVLSCGKVETFAVCRKRNTAVGKFFKRAVKRISKHFALVVNDYGILAHKLADASFHAGKQRQNKRQRRIANVVIQRFGKLACYIARTRSVNLRAERAHTLFQGMFYRSFFGGIDNEINGRQNRNLFSFAADRTRRVEIDHFFYLVAEKVNSYGNVIVHRENLQNIAAKRKTPLTVHLVHAGIPHTHKAGAQFGQIVFSARFKFDTLDFFGH